VASENSSDTHQIAVKLQQLQDEMWVRAVVARKTEGSEPPSTVLQSLNEVTASSDRVLKTMESRLPGTVWFLLFAMTLIAVIAAGYHSGLGGARRRSIAALAYALAFSAVLVMVLDADSPQLGQLQESRNALIELRGRLSSTP
jgi:hypothetical protein